MSLALFIDEDSLHRRTIQTLRRAGFDCLTVTEAGRTALSDSEQLEYAASTERTIFTRNAGDFAALNTRWFADGRTHGGIIVVAEQLMNPGMILRAMNRVATVFDNETIRGEIIYLRNYA